MDGGGGMFSAIFHMRDLLLLPVMLIPIGPSPPEKIYSKRKELTKDSLILE